MAGDARRDELADDRALVRAMLGGDRRALDRFCDDFLPPLYRFAASRVRADPELTREIAQATLVRAIGRLESSRGDAALTTWLFACCRNEIADHFRRIGRRPEVEAPDDEPEASADGPERSLLRAESARRVHDALDRIRADYGRVLEWKYIDGLPVREIADRLQLRLKATESLLTRARNAFREAYRQPRTGRSP